jgi:YbbR domain-containing protein
VESVQVTVRAPDRVLKRLSRDSFRAIVDLSGVQTRESTAFVIVTAPEEKDVEILQVDPPFVNVTLEPRVERTIPVRVRRQGTPRTGYEVTSTRVTPTEVTVSGPESIVQLADQATAEAVLTGLQAPLRLTPALYVESRQGGRLSGLTIDPPTATVDVSITPQILTQTLVVAPSIKGSPAMGYTAASVQVEPAAVKVSGPIDAIQILQSSVPTADVDITDATGPQELTRSVALRLPANLRTEQDQVIVKVRIQPARGEQIYQVVPQVTGLASGLTASVVPSTVEVRLTGEMLALQRLSPTSISVTAEVDAPGPGSYPAELRAQQPSGFQLVDLRPRMVTVLVSRR